MFSANGHLKIKKGTRPVLILSTSRHTTESACISPAGGWKVDLEVWSVQSVGIRSVGSRFLKYISPWIKESQFISTLTENTPGKTPERFPNFYRFMGTCRSCEEQDQKLQLSWSHTVKFVWSNRFDQNKCLEIKSNKFDPSILMRHQANLKCLIKQKKVWPNKFDKINLTVWDQLYLPKIRPPVFFFLNNSLNIQHRTPKPSAMCFYLPVWHFGKAHITLHKCAVPPALSKTGSVVPKFCNRRLRGPRQAATHLSPIGCGHSNFKR